MFGFFESLGSRVSWDGDKLIVENVPGKFEEYFGRVSPYEFVFDKRVKGEFAGKGSEVLEKILKFLKRGGKTSILRIDFSQRDDSKGPADVDIIMEKLRLKNCEVESVGRRFKNNFFTRFSFVVNFNYLNESERVVEEVFVYDGEVIDGNLEGYDVVDGEKLDIDKGKVKADYEVALKGLGERVREVQERIAGELKEKMDEEVGRIRDYYEVQLREFGGDLSDKLSRVKELELEIRGAGEEEKEVLLRRLEKLRSGLVKVGDDDAVERVEREREATIDDAKQKFSLGVDRKLVNTTVVYYPVFVFKIYLREGSLTAMGSTSSNTNVPSEDPRRAGKRLIEICYDPLTGEMDGLDCESCGKSLDGVNVCANGHLSCSECMGVCGECGGKFCRKCLERSCSVCGRKLCKNCLRVCRGCGRYTCATHMRKDCVSGDERCTICLRACLRCNGVSQEKFFGEARDGSKVCGKCLGKERRSGIIDKVFDR